MVAGNKCLNESKYIVKKEEHSKQEIEIENGRHKSEGLEKKGNQKESV